MSKPHLSGWCSPCTPGNNAHDRCEEYLKRGQLPLGCNCPNHAEDKP